MPVSVDGEARNSAPVHTASLQSRHARSAERSASACCELGAAATRPRRALHHAHHKRDGLVIDDADAESIVRRQSVLHGTFPCSEAARTERRRSRGRGVRRHGARTRRRSNGPTSPSRRRLDGVLTHHPCLATRDGGCHVIVLVTKIVPLIEDGDEGGSAGAKHGGRLIKYRARVGFTRL